MKYAFLTRRSKLLVLLLAASLTLVFPGLAAAAGMANVTVTAPAQSVGSGEQFTVNIVIEPNNTIAGVQFNLAFDASLLTVNSVVEGGLLSQGGAATYFNPGSIDNVAGTINGIYGAIITPGQTVSQTGTMAVITMTAGATEGTASLTLSGVIVGDINGSSVSVNPVNGQVTVDINYAAVLATVGNKAVNEGELLQFTVSASDPDGDNLTYSASNLPSGASFDAGTQTFSWQPRYDQAGSYSSVRLEVSDGQLGDFEDIIITVNQPYADWDTNTDGSANVLDIIRVGQHWDENGPTGWIREDVNEDGTVNVLDIIVIGQNWTG